MADKDGGSTTSKRRQKAHWPVDAERKLIEIWAEVLHRFSGSMTKKKAKAQKAADLLNDYARQELPGISYSVDEVLAKVDNISAKARRFYTQYQRPKETGRAADDEDLGIDVEAALLSWPNFQVFLNVFRNHPSLGPGAADDSSQVAPTEQTFSPRTVTEDSSHLAVASCDISAPPSRPVTPANAPTEGSDTDDTVEYEPRTKKKKKQSDKPKATPRSVTTQAAFLDKMGQQQEEMQQKQFQHELKMQVVLKEHEDRREESRQRFEFELRQKDEEARARMERERQQHQQTMMQQQMLFQGELLKRLFDDSKDK